jgi:hypothetical protein
VPEEVGHMVVDIPKSESNNLLANNLPLEIRCCLLRGPRKNTNCDIGPWEHREQNRRAHDGDGNREFVWLIAITTTEVQPSVVTHLFVAPTRI